MEGGQEEKQHKVHRAPKSGLKYEKKKRTAEKRREELRRKDDTQGGAAEEPVDPEEERRKAMLRNPRAFSVFGARNARLQQARKAEKIHRKLHPLIVDRSSQLAQKPPVIVAVSGPKGSGKSTLISSLIKHYTRKNVTDIKGPITVVAGKKRRLTFIEVPNEMNSMVDAAFVFSSSHPFTHTKQSPLHASFLLCFLIHTQKNRRHCFADNRRSLWF